MKEKTGEKAAAINYRKKGYSYSEIQKLLGVSKASLSSWLKNIKLTEIQAEVLQTKMQEGRKRGVLSVRQKKKKQILLLKRRAESVIENISEENLFYFGLALYWGEGSKQTPADPSTRVMFTNSDPAMIALFMLWLVECLDVTIAPETVRLALYLHRHSPVEETQKHWKNFLGVDSGLFNKTVYKSVEFDKARKGNYRGTLRITLLKSSEKNRLISKYIERICELKNISCGVV